MEWNNGGALLEEERHVRLSENVVVAGVAFALFWTSFGVSWYVSNQRVAEFSTFTSAQKADWCSRVNSTLHAALVVLGVIYALCDITWADGFMPMSSIRAASFIFSIAIGYFLCDLIVIVIWPVPMQWVFIVHHIVAVVPYFINNFISCCAACQFGLLLFLLVELATLPLNVRGFLDARDRQDSKQYMCSIYATYILWSISRTALPIFVLYDFWVYAYPSKRNHTMCLYPNLVSAHVIALFCIGVFFFVHTPELIRIRRETHLAQEAAKSTNEVVIHTDDADLVDSEGTDLPSSKARESSSLRSLTLSLSRARDPITDDSYDDIELGVMPRSARARAKGLTPSAQSVDKS